MTPYLNLSHKETTMMPNERYVKLKEYLSEENPVLLDIIDKYAALDELAYTVGFLNPTQTYTSNISWWPMISVLGTFSAGKSTFINEYLGQQVQVSGNQAIDDKFTVLCYGENEEPLTLPGLALDADPRFPFYNISKEVNKVDPGEGNRVNLYLQLKTLQSEKVKGKILIDSPGFDADSQRDGILKITSHIVDISDLVLVFFDARHPEPGAMRDTLEHLVSSTIKHKDANKILYILNQIDTTAKEDNLESVISSWQRALSQEGLISGNFYGLYNEASSVPIENEAQKERLMRKRDHDLAQITDRMDKVGIERAYRIIKALEDFSTQMKEEKIPQLQAILKGWSKQVFWTEIILATLLLVGLGVLQMKFELLSQILASSFLLFSSLAGAVVIGAFCHFKIRALFASKEAKKYRESDPMLSNAIEKNTKWWIPMFIPKAKKWHNATKEKLTELANDARSSIQKLNNQFIRPTGVTKKED